MRKYLAKGNSTCWRLSSCPVSSLPGMTTMRSIAERRRHHKSLQTLPRSRIKSRISNKQTSKQINKQTNKHASKQAITYASHYVGTLGKCITYWVVCGKGDSSSVLLRNALIDVLQFRMNELKSNIHWSSATNTIKLYNI